MKSLRSDLKAFQTSHDFRSSARNSGPWTHQRGRGDKIHASGKSAPLHPLPWCSGGDVTSRVARVHGWEGTTSTAVPVHFREFQVGKTRGFLERVPQLEAVTSVEKVCTKVRRNQPMSTDSRDGHETPIRQSSLFCSSLLTNWLPVDRQITRLSVLTRSPGPRCLCQDVTESRSCPSFCSSLRRPHPSPPSRM